MADCEFKKQDIVVDMSSLQTAIANEKSWAEEVDETEANGLDVHAFPVSL